MTAWEKPEPKNTSAKLAALQHTEVLDSDPARPEFRSADLSTIESIDGGCRDGDQAEVEESGPSRPRRPSEEVGDSESQDGTRKRGPDGSPTDSRRPAEEPLLRPNAVDAVTGECDNVALCAQLPQWGQKDLEPDTLQTASRSAADLPMIASSGAGQAEEGEEPGRTRRSSEADNDGREISDAAIPPTRKRGLDKGLVLLQPSAILDSPPPQPSPRSRDFSSRQDNQAREEVQNPLAQYSVTKVVDLISRRERIVVITGAGICTNLGLPDFRSGTGLYSKDLSLVDRPEDVFEINTFAKNPSMFYSAARDLMKPMERFSPTHAFIALLQEKGKLLTNYTQNIDNLEARAGIRSDKLIQCHGSLEYATCMRRRCRYRRPLQEFARYIDRGEPPPCPMCEKITKRPKRAARGPDDTPGIMKPDIVFYGEKVPRCFAIRRKKDKNSVDLVLVIGTSLTTAPVNEMVGNLPPQVPRINISKTPIDDFPFNAQFIGNCDVVISELRRRLRWSHKKILERGVQVQQELPGRYKFTEVGGSP